MAPKPLVTVKPQVIEKSEKSSFIGKLWGGKWTKDEVLDGVHWYKQFAAVAIGVLSGFLPLVQINGLFAFGAGVLIGCIGFYRFILRIDPDDFGGHGALIGEGLPFSLALFLLCWIMTFTCFHTS